MKPYFQDKDTTLYCADNREVLPTLGRFNLLLTDPPYGINADSKMARNGGKWGFSNYGKSKWDDKPADPQPCIEICENAIVWGGNYFSLPPSHCWLIWNKMQRDFDFADAELAWTNLDKAVRIFDFSRKRLAVCEDKQHPTQKPLPLMTWCLGFVPTTKTCLDPFAGSGTTGVACKLRGVHCTMIEREEKYCEIIVNRLRQGVLITV